MQRTGRKHEPTYRLVLTDSKNSAQSGKYLEMLGSYDSRHGDKSDIKADRVSHWISVGAQVSHTVHNLLMDKKIITGKKINKLPLKKAIKKDEPEAPAPAAAPIAEIAPSPAPVEETPAVGPTPEVTETVA